jgi:Fe-S-cluster containining protein
MGQNDMEHNSPMNAPMANSPGSLNNYLDLAAKVDAMCRRIVSQYVDLLACRKGCDDCCRHISIFPVEAHALAMALRDLPPEEGERIRKLARKASPHACPLLENGLCLLYLARPIICRTHGFPLFIDREEGKGIDFCPKNFEGIKSFPADFVIDLKILNTTLAAIDAVFTASSGLTPWSGQNRLTIAEALLLETDV